MMNKFKVFIAGDLNVFAEDEDKAVMVVEEKLRAIPKQFNVDVFAIKEILEEE